jgi:hypothetical protein
MDSYENADGAVAARARQLRQKGITATGIAKMLGVSRATVYRYLSEYGAAYNLRTRSPCSTPIKPPLARRMKANEDTPSARRSANLWLAYRDATSAVCAKLTANMSHEQWPDWVSPREPLRLGHQDW